MLEFSEITEKYQPAYITEQFSSLEGLHAFSLQFFRDVAAIYDALARVRNVDRNPSGFSLDDAPILGLLVRISKLLKECVAYYEHGNAEVVAIFERAIIEATTISSYLMLNGAAAMEPGHRVILCMQRAAQFGHADLIAQRTRDAEAHHVHRTPPPKVGGSRPTHPRCAAGLRSRDSVPACKQKAIALIL